MRALTTAVVLALASVSAAEARQSAALRDALMAAVRPALPFPEASNDGTPSGDDPGPLWTVHWPAEDSAVVEVLANPLNAENHARIDRELALRVVTLPGQPVVSQRDLTNLRHSTGLLKIADRLVIVGLGSLLRLHRRLLNCGLCLQGARAVLGVERIGENLDHRAVFRGPVHRP